jgi:hypothetical protein
MQPHPMKKVRRGRLLVLLLPLLLLLPPLLLLLPPPAVAAGDAAVDHPQRLAVNPPLHLLPTSRCCAALRRPACCLPCLPCSALQEVRELIAKCWAPNPEDRPPFAELVGTLEGIMARVPRTTMVKGGASGAEGGSGCCTVS